MTRRHLALGLGFVAIAAAQSASAEVYVYGNAQTARVVIRGNIPDAAYLAAKEAKGIQEFGWEQVGIDDEQGWGALSCVESAGRYHFFMATGQKTSAEAGAMAKAKAERFMNLHGGKGRIVFMCAPRWHNRGQPIAFGSEGSGRADASRDNGEPDTIVSGTKAIVRDAVTTGPKKDYKRDCLPPPATAAAEIRPIAPGAAPVKDKRPPRKAWQPASWCPPVGYTTFGVRG